MTLLLMSLMIFIVLHLNLNKNNMIEEKDLQMMVPSKCFSDFWRTLEMELNHCELNFSLT